MSYFLEHFCKSLATIRYQETGIINCANDKFDKSWKEVKQCFPEFKREYSENRNGLIKNWKVWFAEETILQVMENWPSEQRKIIEILSTTY